MSIKVPVIMYHSVGRNNPDWIWNHLITPVNVFEAQIKFLSKRVFNSINLQELYVYMKYNNKISDNPIVLTFDDGYLDNWVYAFPILKKYGMKGTIFVNPEFVDPIDKCRLNLDDVWNGKCEEKDLFSKGFLSWHEMRKMEESGIIDIQSHSMSHTWYFTGDEIVDFHHPGNDQFPWLFWNAHPERKSFYLNENQETFVPYGTPIYKNGRSLGIKRYFEDTGLSRHLTTFVKNQEDDFFTCKDWKNALFQQVNIYKSENKLNDRYETDEEQEERFRYELFKSKALLEDKLNKKIDFLCWAGGAFNNKALSIANEAGYLSSTLFYNDSERKNSFGDDPSEINRTGCVSEFNWHNNFISYTEPRYFMANIKYFCGDKIYLWVIRLYKIKYFAKFIIKKLLKRGEMR
ncbi:MAG: polysaccharide deacetylase family protein [Nitrospirae bacterium]|nr:polysaccharide deacetylase family protein [Nitrospirota bacterium]